jgi:NADPH:quinone reductase-like Zn-dependent oxidoreductase
MRALICRQWGGIEQLQIGEAPVPRPGRGEVLIRVKATAVNYADAIMVAGRYQTKPELPFSPGLETAGVIDVIVREDRVVDRGNAQRIQCRNDLRGAGPRRAAIDEQGLARRRHDQGARTGADVDEIDARERALGVGPLDKQDEDEDDEGREFLGHAEV